ncbi:MAG: hypothetical protein KDC85_06055 [Saprospiraceae bacterium]|nr:hypothetical protein [Saprospiraceae bacterium]MCB9323935.1 hypothetical protein [Lewinellaceae bacterium]
MRKLERQQCYFGYTEGVENLLKNLTAYCFVSDIIASNRILYFKNGKHNYENAFLIDEKLNNTLKSRHYNEEEILFFLDSCDLKENFFYLETESNCIEIKSLTQKGRYSLDFIYNSLHAEFGDAINEAYNSTKNNLYLLIQLKDRINKEVLTPQSYLDFVKDDFINFLKDTVSSSLLAVRSTYIKTSDSYKILKNFVLENSNIVDEERSKIIKNKIHEFDLIINNNYLLPKMFFLFNAIEELLNEYNYARASDKLKEYGQLILSSSLTYAKELYENTTNFNWTHRHFLIEPLKIEEQLLKSYKKFEGVIIKDEETFLGLMRLLSKAQLDLIYTRNYANAIVNIQKFMEAYLKAIGADKDVNKKGVPFGIQKIKDKIKKALDDQEKLKNELHRKIIDTFSICFDEEEKGELKKICTEYLPINHPRNEQIHDDLNKNELYFKKHLSYLDEVQLGYEENTKIFYKWIEWFELPSTNIFNQINNRIKELLSKPDMIFESQSK